VVAVFAKFYLRAQTEEVNLDIGTKCGERFSGMLGSIDYMHWVGRIAHLLGRKCTKATLESVPWYLRLADQDL
jgi:hypothetical protein